MIHSFKENPPASPMALLPTGGSLSLQRIKRGCYLRRSRENLVDGSSFVATRTIFAGNVCPTIPSANPSIGLPSSSSAAPMTPPLRSDEHTSELQSLMRTSYAVFCLKTKQDTQI